MDEIKCSSCNNRFNEKIHEIKWHCFQTGDIMYYMCGPCHKKFLPILAHIIQQFIEAEKTARKKKNREYQRKRILEKRLNNV